MNANLNTITLTGVDDHTDVERLVELSRQHHKVEWGVLYSPKLSGQGGRYPSVDFALDFLRRMRQENIATAVHLCGAAVPEVLAGTNAQAQQLVHLAGRVQLNFNQKRHGFDLAALNHWIEVQHKPVITQFNSANSEVHLGLSSPFHQVLFDASGGRGVLAQAWQEPLHGKFCGYAGGLGPDNVREQVAQIGQVCSKRFWIDMENAIRTEDRLNLDLCQQVLNNLTPSSTLQGRMPP